MHGTGRLPCQKPERIPLIAARCVPLEAPHRATAGGVFGRTAFIFSDKNGVVARTVGDRRAGRFAVPAQSRRGQTERSGYFPFK